MEFKVGDAVKVTAEGALGYGLSGKIRGVIEGLEMPLYLVNIEDGTRLYPCGYIVQSEENLAPLKTLADSRWKAEMNSHYFVVNISGHSITFGGVDATVLDSQFDNFNMWQSRKHADVIARKTKLLWLIGQLNIAAGGNLPTNERDDDDTWQVEYDYSSNAFCTANIDYEAFCPSGVVIQGRQRAQEVVAELNRLKDNGELDWYFKED